MQEWTLEYTSRTDFPCSYRGGDYGISGNITPVINRNYELTTNSLNYITARPALW